MSTLKEVMAELEAAGSAQTRKTYARHGFGPNMFGVSYAVLGKMVKKLKRNHALAVELWKTGNEDARVLATMIADPAAFTQKQLEEWMADAKHHALADAVASRVAGPSAHCGRLLDKWLKSKDDLLSQGGWLLVCHLAREGQDIADEWFEDMLGRSERNIHAAKNWTRYTMNSAVIAIGVRNPALEKKALAAAKRIGKVEVDHGDTSCKTPDATAYIKKTVERKRGKG